LTIRAELFDGRHAFTVSTSRMPQVVAASASSGPAFILRVAANAYRDAGASDDPGQARFCPEQAWVFFGELHPADITRTNETLVGISVGTTVQAARGLVVSMRGNVELVERVLRQADWSLLRARLGG
jgi:hypothetical protein